ncbi:MAG: hypothetical protein RLZZ139_2112 [Cyanobacteriota bacterium]
MKKSELREGARVFVANVVYIQQTRIDQVTQGKRLGIIFDANVITQDRVSKILVKFDDCEKPQLVVLQRLRVEKTMEHNND